MCNRVCIYMPWGRKHQTPEDLEDEVYAAEVERQNQTELERDREQRQTFTQTQPHALPNPNDKAEVKGHIMNHHNGQLDKEH